MRGLLTNLGGLTSNKVITVTAYQTITYTANVCVLMNTTGQSLAFMNPSLSISTGTLTASTWYFVYVAWNPTTSTLIAFVDTNATTPSTLPSGYTYYALQGAVVTTTGTSGLICTKQMGRFAHYVVGGINCAGLPVVMTGATGSYSTPTFTTYAMSGFVPSITTAVKVTGHVQNGMLAVCPNAAYGAYNSTTNPPYFYINNANADGGMGLIPLETMNIYVYSQAGSVLAVAGWEDAL